LFRACRRDPAGFFHVPIYSNEKIANFELSIIDSSILVTNKKEITTALFVTGRNELGEMQQEYQ
jgi:hypothetical protein